jgi:S-(hydroxymethyl)glutathione dehydrogenase / alcohol dehydrogenase
MINFFTAAVLENTKKPLSVIKNIEIPKIKKNQVLVKMYYSAVCGSQLFEINGQRGKDHYLPHLLGHEGTGKIIKIKSKNSNLKVNDLVFLSWISNKKLKNESINFKYPNKNKVINSGSVTTFSNYTVVSINKVFKLPKKVSLTEGVLLGCALPTGAGMVFNQSNNLKNKNVLVIGAGGVGLSSILALKAKKTKKIFVYEKNKKKIIFFKKYIKGVVFFDKIRDIYEEKINFDYVYECSGFAMNIEHGFKLLKNTGVCIFSSHPKFKDKISFNPHEFIKGKKLEGSWGGQINFKKDLKKLVELITKFKFIEKIYFKRIYSLFEINNAISDFKNGKNIRTLIKLN